MPQINYRILKPGDIEETFNLILKVSKEFMFPTYSKDGQIEFRNKLIQIKSKLSDKKYTSFVAEENGKIVGMVQGSIRDSYASLGLLFVDKKFHRKGIGTELMNKAEKKFIKEVDLVKLYSSIFALEFYQQLGYLKTTSLRSKKGIVYYPMKKSLS